MLAFQRSDGKQLWGSDRAGPHAQYLHPKNSNASATATTDGTRIYAFFGNKGVMASTSTAGSSGTARSDGSTTITAPGSPLLSQRQAD